LRVLPVARIVVAFNHLPGLAGLGDVACWYDEKHVELHALKGATLISVELRRSGNPTEAITGVMKSALERLR
jgi:hypothetical protein